MNNLFIFELNPWNIINDFVWNMHTFSALNKALRKDLIIKSLTYSITAIFQSYYCISENIYLIKSNILLIELGEIMVYRLI